MSQPEPVSQRAWPHRYRVVVTDPDGREQIYHVVTWEYAEKAIEIATGVPARPPGRGRPQPHATAVDLGPVERDAHGTMQLRSDDRIDRGEF